MSGYTLALAGYAFTAPISTPALISIVAILGVLALSLPMLLRVDRSWPELRAAALVLLPLAVVLLSNGAPTVLWVVLLISALSVPRLLPARWAFAVLILALLVWLTSSYFIPAVAWTTALAEVGVRGAAVLMVAVATRLTLRPPRPRPEPIPEAPLQRLTRACERLRGSERREDIFEELASAAKASGQFSFASVSTVDWRAGTTKLEVALGASGHTLGATETLTLGWNDFVALLRDDERVSDHAYLAAALPFRSIPGEYYMLVPLRTRTGEICALLSIGDDSPSARSRLSAAAPLLELLAAQGSAALENIGLQSSLIQRVENTTTELGRNAEDAQRARSRAENLYHIVRALSTTLEPQPLLDQALILIAKATHAERGGIMLVDQRTGRLMFGTNLDRHLTQSEAAALERGQGLAGWVVENRTAAIIPNTAEDSRWMARSEHDSRGRSALAVPLENDGVIVGAIILINNHLDHFTEEHAQFVQVIGDQVATMLANVRQHQSLAEKNAKLSQMLEQREEEASKSFAIVRSIGDGVVVGDRVGRIRLINPAAERLLNIEAAKYLGQSLIALPSVPDIESQAGEAETFQDFEINGKIIRAYSTPVFTNANDWMGSVIVYHDITAQQLADRLKTEFVATASHELRTPLTSIGGYIDLLLLNTLGMLNDQQRQFLEVVRNNVERLTAILNDLLDVSRIESGQVRLQRGPVNIEELIHSTVMEMHQQWSNKHISLAIDIPADLPPIVADGERLRQVMINLISNAYKYTRDGGRIDLVVRNGGGDVNIAIKDSGVGIADKDKEHIFTRFYRTENPLKEQAGGTGLGLSITKSLVELHGGRIWFDSVEGQGTTFNVQLPIGGDADWTPAPWLEGV
jgi:signal transduction histidine kinase